MTVHSFTVADAQLYGVEKATILFNLRFWLDKNKANNRHYYDGYVWTYNSAKAFHDLFPYLSPQKIARLLRDLEEDGVILSGSYNKAGYDRTKWYTIVQEYKLHCSDLKNGMFSSEQPIPDINTDSKPDTNLSSADDHAQDVLDIYHSVIEQHQPNWTTVKTFSASRKRLCNKAYKLVKPRAEKHNMRQLDVLFNLFAAMAQDDFYSGKPSNRNPKGYRCTLETNLRENRLLQAIDQLGSDE